MKLAYSEAATEDLVSLGIWIEDRAGTATAQDYLARLRAECDKLIFAPERGTPQGHLLPGARSVTYKRRVRIFYRVEHDRVLILRLIHTAHDLRAQFTAD